MCLAKQGRTGTQLVIQVYSGKRETGERPAFFLSNFSGQNLHLPFALFGLHIAFTQRKQQVKYKLLLGSALEY